jgi:ArsR family transcriptional regulator
VLRAAGIVRDEKRGNQVIYSLALPCVATFTRCLVAAAKGRKVEVRTCCR